MTASAWKTSAGAAARVPVAQVVNLTRQLKAYQDAGCMVIGLAADGEVSLPDLDLADGPLVVVVGSEGKGLSRLVADTCDQLVAIPMASSLESLNAGVAASVTLYDVAQKRAEGIADAPPRSCARSATSLAWLVVAVPAWALLFTHSSSEMVLASHDAVVHPTLDGMGAARHGALRPGPAHHVGRSHRRRRGDAQDDGEQHG